MNREEKHQQIEQLRQLFLENSSAFLTSFSGLKVEELNGLRSQLRKEGIGYQVIKNTLAKKALEGTGLEGLSKLLEGPTAMAFTSEEPAKPAKILRSFARDNEKLVVKGGYLHGEVFGAADVERIASLPGRDELRAMVLGALIGVPRGILTLFNEVPAGFVRLIDARRAELEKQTGGETAA